MFVLRLLILLSIVCIWGCGGDDSSEESGNQNSTPAIQTDPKQQLQEALDGVQAAPSHESGYRLVRYLDYWHQGGVSDIAVEIRADGTAVDHAGNQVAFGLAEWKGFLELAQTEPAGFVIRAMRSDLYQDDLGEVTRHIYQVTIDDPTRVVFHLQE